MPATRLLAAMAAGALVAVPGFALAQGPPSETPPETTPPVETPAPPDREVEALEEEPEEVEVRDQDVEAAEDDEGHGATISTLAECLPSGRDLHGTGLTKGFVMRQASAGGPIELPDGQSFAIGEICDVVKAMVGVEVPERAKGRPDWAGPKDRDDGPPGLSEGRGRGAPAG